jgi:hypothetical protein
MIPRGPQYKQEAINIVGSSIFGRYPKISIEKTYNMLISDGWLVPYAGYQVSIPASSFKNGKVGRALHTSTKFNRLIGVVDSTVYLINLFFNQSSSMSFDTSVIPIGTLQTSSGVVYIAENNKPQIAFSDGTAIYIYDPQLTPAFQTISTIDFVPGYIDFHDTYFLCAAKQDTFYSPPATNTWRLSASNDGTSWPNDAAHIGLLQTKSDVIQAVVRFPSRGNMVFVMGSTVTESWFDVGYQLFPYQRNNSFNIDYGCLNPATIAATDEIVVWLGQNEKSGPIILYSTGQMPEKITTDGIDYLFSQLTNPADSQAFIYRQDGHLIYHINFYTDNLSLFYDFNTQKFFHASDENLNYFIANEVAFFNNQYYFMTKNNGNMYAFDTIYTTYQGAEIPRFRTCKSIRSPTQEYTIKNDLGFTIEQGETNYQQQDVGPFNLVTQDNKFLITQIGGPILFVTQDGDDLITQDSKNLVSQQTGGSDFDFLVTQQHNFVYTTPAVDLSISTDGGASFGSDFRYELNPIGLRKNKIQWWQLGVSNDFTPLFKFWGLGRFVATDGILNTRQ